MRYIFSILFLFCAGVAGRSQQIHYDISFPNAVHHEAQVAVTVTGVTTGTLTFRMSRSSPGRYATHEFGKNVYDVHLLNGGMQMNQVAGDVYQVSGIRDSVTLIYTLYGNYADGTYSGIDVNSIHLNMPATMMWVEELQHAPITIRFQIPDPSFTIATQLKPGTDAFSFSAPDLQYMMDSPVKIGQLHWREWKVTDKTRTQTIRLALEATATEAEVDSLVNILKRITSQAAKVYGTYPRYDFGVYTFIASINPYVHSDGMEHRNSTMITTGRQFSLNPRGLSVFAHEYFHSWNVERIRPKTLEPFDFTHSNMSDELWIAEGFTQYYGELLLRRAGVVPDTSFAAVAARFINSKVNTPGGRLYTPVQASRLAVYTDAGVSIDETNFDNIFNSYYFYGASVALALDLELRTRYNSSLDAVMQRFWERNGQNEKPYTIRDLQECVAAVSDQDFAKNFFTTYVFNSNVSEIKAAAYKSLVTPFGFELKASFAQQAWIGDMVFNTEKGLQIASNTLRNTPAYDAGLDAGDVVERVDGQSVWDPTAFYRIVRQHKPGDSIVINYVHRGLPMTTSVIAKTDPQLELIPVERNGALTDKMIALRNAWIQPK